MFSWPKHPRQRAIYPPDISNDSLEAKCQSVLDVVNAWCIQGKTMVSINDVLILIKPLHNDRS